MDEKSSSLDAIFNGAVTIRQSRRGYRFSIDALLLAWYVSALPGRTALELGSGSGVVSLALCHKRNDLAVVGVEQQESLHRFAVENVEINQQRRFTPLKGDFRQLEDVVGSARFEIVFSNPPFREKGRGRLNPHPEKAAARHELNGTLADLLNAAAGVVKADGHIALILLHERLPDLRQLLEGHPLRLVQLTEILPFTGRPANLFLALLSREQRRLPDAELAIWKEQNVYTEAVEAILAADWEGGHPLEELRDHSA